MELKGKKFGGIKITNHSKSGSVPISKEQMIELVTAEGINKQFNNIKTDGTLNSVKEQMQGALRKLRGIKKIEIKKGRIEYSYDIPASIKLAVNGDNHDRSKGVSSIVGNVEYGKNESIMEVLKNIKKQRVDYIRKGKDKIKQKKITVTPSMFKLSNGDSKRATVHGMPFNKAVIAGCREESGTFLKINEAKKLPSPFEVKAPTGNKNFVGIEIEFLCKLNNSMLGLELALGKMSKYCQLKTDNSVKDEQGINFFPHELCICVEEDMVDNVIDSICAILNRVGASVNKSCGLHVHLDMRNRNHKLAFHNLTSCQTMFFAMQPKARRDNKFCKKTTSSKFDEYPDTGYGGENRYLAINPYSMRKHKTIEIRLHGGTTNASKIKNWVAILSSVIKSDKELPLINTLAEFKTNLTTDESITKYINERIKKFFPIKAEVEIERDGVAA